MTRKQTDEARFKDIQYRVESAGNLADPVADIKERASSGQFVYLLAHAHDGVIWGKVEDGQLLLSVDAFPEVSPPLRSKTLQQARLFGPKAEVFWWPGEDGWCVRQISEVEDGVKKEAAGPAYDETIVLWGTDEEGTRGGFTLMREADLGIRHAPPIRPTGRRSLGLVVRHYVAYDEAGAAFVALSRLVDLRNEIDSRKRGEL